MPLVLLLSTFGVYALTSARSTVNTDAYAASVGAWRIATTGKPWLDGVDVHQLAGTHNRHTRGQWLSKAPNGHVVTQRMPGPIVAGIPFYWLLGNDSNPRHFSVAPGGIAAAALSAVAVLFIFLSLRRRLPQSVAVTAALVFALATPTWSVSANGLWTHPVTQLGIAGAAYAASRERWWLAGALLGVGIWGRPHVALIAAILGLGLVWSRRQIKPAVEIAVPSVVSLVLLMVWNRAVLGGWSLDGAYGGGQITKAAEGIGSGGDGQWRNYLGFLVSFDRGFLVWSPVVLLLLPALVRSWRTLPDWSRWLVLGGVVYTVFQLRLNYFAGGTGYFGYRHGLELLTSLTPALAYSWPRTGRLAKAVAAPVIALQFGAFTIGAAVEGLFVPLDHVWTDNSVWLGLRAAPLVVGTWLALCLVVGIVAGIRLARTPRLSVG